MIECVPTASELVTNVAWPAFSVPEPNVVTPSRKVTTPDGVPPKDVTVAVNVTTEPKLEGFGFADTVVVVAAAPTDVLTTSLILPAKAMLPSYEAERG